MKTLFWSTCALTLLGSISPNYVAAHSGRTDSSGGHYDRRTGSYHYHNSGTSYAKTTYKAEPRTTYRTSARTSYRQVHSTAKGISQESSPPSSAESRESEHVRVQTESKQSTQEELLEKEQIRRKEKAKRAAAAESILNAARTFKEQEKRALMEKWLRRVVSEYPETESAATARELLGIPDPSAFRTWTDVTGNYRVEAQCVRFEDEIVHLKKRDGKVVQVPISKLSKADQEVIRAIYRRKK